MTVLITGGAGFIGQYVARLLTERGLDVVAMDVLSAQVHDEPQESANRFPGAVLRQDVAEPASWLGLQDVSGIVHLAAETGTAQSMYEQVRYRRTNVEGSRLAAEFAEQRGIPLVLLSSRAVYGEGLLVREPELSSPGRDFGESGTLVPSPESQPHAPVSVYGQTKSDAEAAAMEVLDEAALVVLRPQNVIGMGQALRNPYTGVLAAFLSRLKAGLNLQVYGDGTQTRDFVYVGDVARAVVWALDVARPGEPQVYNVGTGRRLTLTDLAKTMIDASLGEPVEVEHVQVHRAGDIEHACADMTNAWAAGMPRPRLTSEEAIADFVHRSWALRGADPEAWDRALAELADHGLTSQ